MSLPELKTMKAAVGGSSMPASMFTTEQNEIMTPEYELNLRNTYDPSITPDEVIKKTLREALDYELEMIQMRILISGRAAFLLKCNDDVKTFLINEEVDHGDRTRPLKKAIDQHLMLPLSNLIGSGQITAGEVLIVDLDETERKLRFKKSVAL
jgi:ATP-dependent Clp protease ATP-binding subunit ClpA